MQLIVFGVLAFAVVGGALATLYYFAMIPVLWVQTRIVKRQLRKDPEATIARFMTQFRREQQKRMR